MRTIDLRLDVTVAADLGEEAAIAVTVTLPDPATLPATPVVCFAKPGGGYSKGYYTVDLPGPAKGAQADWHAARGWVFVSVDHLGVGDSTTHHAPQPYDYTHLSATAHAAEQEVLRRLRDGTLAEGFPCRRRAGRDRDRSVDGRLHDDRATGSVRGLRRIAVLGYSAVHTTPPSMPGGPTIVPPWVPRDVLPVAWGRKNTLPPEGIVNKHNLAVAALTSGDAEAGPAMAWGFHDDDVDRQILVDDLTDFPARGGNPPPWASTTLPIVVATWCIVPGAVAPEAAAVTVPVLAAFGERDVSADPKGEARAYQSATSIDWFVCPRMGHMHNFAGTRTLFWLRLETWGEWVRARKAELARTR